MRILLTNDDGIRAPGIAALYTTLLDRPGRQGGPLGDILAVAPLTVQSATGHGVTFHQPLMTSRETIDIGDENLTGLAVDGRPADCVKLAVSELFPEHHSLSRGTKPDLLISGMNAGANCGINVIYSGTVAAAIEAAFLGVPSIAVSLMLGKGRPRFDVAARHAREVINRLLKGGLPAPHECLSINIPATESDGPLPEVRVCPMNTHGLIDKYERRVNPRGELYFWAAGHGLDFHATEGDSDVDLLKAGKITVTPLHYDLSAHGAMGKWRDRLGETSSRPGV